MCTYVHSWVSRRGRPPPGTRARRQPLTSSLSARTTASRTTGQWTEWKWPACELNSDGYSEYSSGGWMETKFKMRCESNAQLNQPTREWVFRSVSSYCSSPDIQPEGLTQHPRLDSQIRSQIHKRPPSVKVFEPLSNCVYLETESCSQVSTERITDNLCKCKKLFGLLPVQHPEGISAGKYL